MFTNNEAASSSYLRAYVEEIRLETQTDLLILECTSESKEKMSEGQLLWELMRILGYEKHTRLEITKGKNHFLGELNRVNAKYLHIAAHGDVDIKKGTYIVTPRRGRVYANDLVDFWREKDEVEIPELVVISACKAGHIDLVKVFSRMGCRYCIAPLHDTYWEDAVVFLVMFYRLLIGEECTPWISYRNTMIGLDETLPRMRGAWSFYEWGEKIMPATIK